LGRDAGRAAVKIDSEQRFLRKEKQQQQSKSNGGVKEKNSDGSSVCEDVQVVTMVIEQTKRKE